MKKSKIYIIATLTCVGIVLIYAFIGVLFNWQHGGGTLPMIILFGALAATWKGIIGFSKPKVNEENVDTNENEKAI